MSEIADGVTSAVAVLAKRPCYVPLRVHSEYSISDGIVRIDDLIAKAQQFALPAVAISDIDNLFAAVKLYSTALAAGIKPIVGIDLAIDDGSGEPPRLLLLVKNHRGYQQLCRLLSHAYQHRRRVFAVDRSLFGEIGNDGLIALSGGGSGDVGRALAKGQHDEAVAAAKAWARCFPGAYYLEVQRYGQPQQEALLSATCTLAEQCGLPVVATHPIQFIEADDMQAHEARVCIAEGTLLDDADRRRRFTEQQYLLPPEAMAERFADCPTALAETLNIAARCSLDLPLGKPVLPDFQTPGNLGVADYLAEEAARGLEARLTRLFADPVEREQKRPSYQARLHEECAMIAQMGFPGYFLIVAEFINWAKQQGIPVGPGRGSGAGSLVAYCLGITDLDPIAYALLFERFLNPERVSMPDFDIDFCQNRRGEVIDHVRERYGDDSVAQIATFGTMSSKAVVRDVGRVLGMSYSLCDRISKLIPVEQNKPVPLKAAIAKEPLLAELQNDPRDGEMITELFRLALALEGIARNVGMHAGGVLIARGKISDYCPIWRADTDSTETISQLDKDDVELAGLVKFDFLGLRNLTIIAAALAHIKTLHGIDVDIDSLKFDDDKVYAMLRQTNTTAIFQLESDGMKKLLKKIAPDRFEDIIAVIALFRPGPLGSGMIDDFILRKKGKQEIDYFHPNLTTCLSPTYGVIVYQEQVMQISQIIGGYSLGKADMLRRAMGKKKADEMASHQEMFVSGAVANGYTAALAQQLFELMVKFAEYGFNKSHTAAYAVVTYQTAWLKTYYPAAFMAATLSSEMHNTDSIELLVNDALANHLSLAPPDINCSDFEFIPIDNKQICYGLGAIKGVGESAVRLLVAERQRKGRFTDLFDLCCRIDKRLVNRRTLESLIRAGACDTLNGQSRQTRSAQLANLEIALSYAEQKDAAAAQQSLFDNDEPDLALPLPAMPSMPPWSERVCLQQEKQALGFYLSGHPYTIYRHELQSLGVTPLARLRADHNQVRVAGIIVDVKIQAGKRGKFAVVKLDDSSAQRELMLYNGLFEAMQSRLVNDELIMAHVKTSPDRFGSAGGLRLVAESVMTLADLRQQFGAELTIDFNLASTADANGHELERDIEQRIKALKTLLIPYFSDNGAAVKLKLTTAKGSCELRLGSAYRLRLTDDALQLIRWHCGGATIDYR